MWKRDAAIRRVVLSRLHNYIILTLQVGRTPRMLSSSKIHVAASFKCNYIRLFIDAINCTRWKLMMVTITIVLLTYSFIGVLLQRL